jgi:exopolyphosphatase / guanosine-5'-triphosphate,3'-diphosphate pyrophosphatase
LRCPACVAQGRVSPTPTRAFYLEAVQVNLRNLCRSTPDARYRILNMENPTPNAQRPTPPPGRFASVDVGTNTVKMLVADLSADGATPVFEQGVTVRLGEGMQASGMRIREAAMRRALDALAEFTAQAQALGVQDTAAVGTAALRDAVNREEFLHRAEERCGLQIAVIPGEEEARLSYLAVRRDRRWRHSSHLLVIDIGGGSTEIIQGEPGTDRIAARTSVNLGAVKLTESLLRSDPPAITQLAAAQQQAAEQFAKVALTPSEAKARIIGVGGTFTTLGAIDLGGKVDAETLHGHVLTLESVEEQIARFAARTIEERKMIPGLDPARADIILGGAILLSQALARLGSPAVEVSTRGLRWGVLYDRFL